MNLGEYIVSSSESEPEGPESGMSSPERFAFALHEVSNALTVVLGWLDMAARAKDPQEAEKALAVAREHARRGQVMARRAIGAAADSDRTCRTAAALAEFAAVSVRPQAAPVNVRILTEIGPGTDCAVDADGPALQILTNLLSNAVKYAPGAPDIDVTARGMGEVIVISVRDRGVGIDEGELPRMFERFFRASTSTGIAGTGIGLNLTKMLVEMHGGSIEVESHAGKGSTFTVRLPLAGPAQADPGALAQPESAAADAARGGRRTGRPASTRVSRSPHQ